MAGKPEIARENGKKGGRPRGSHKPHIQDYWTPEQIEEFFRSLYERAQKDSRLAVWCGEQLSGKAQQNVDVTSGGERLRLAFDPMFNATAPEAEGDSE